MPQELKKAGGVSAISAQLAKIKTEAERLEVMDKAAGILAELLYTENLLAEVKEYRAIMLHVSTCTYCGWYPEYGALWNQPFCPL